MIQDWKRATQIPQVADSAICLHVAFVRKQRKCEDICARSSLVSYDFGMMKQIKSYTFNAYKYIITEQCRVKYLYSSFLVAMVNYQTSSRVSQDALQ